MKDREKIITQLLSDGLVAPKVENQRANLRFELPEETAKRVAGLVNPNRDHRQCHAVLVCEWCGICFTRRKGSIFHGCSLESKMFCEFQCYQHHRSYVILRDFWNHYSVSPKGCWEWNGGYAPNGYGQIKIKSRHFTCESIRTCPTNREHANKQASLSCWLPRRPRLTSCGGEGVMKPIEEVCYVIFIACTGALLIATTLWMILKLFNVIP